MIQYGVSAHVEGWHFGVSLPLVKQRVSDQVGGGI